MWLVCVGNLIYRWKLPFKGNALQSSAVTWKYRKENRLMTFYNFISFDIDRQQIPVK